ncbi:MAG: glycosyltransferase family 2 protein [Crocinitomicaceae bacterium]|nr:glycosyltransferase family 2 protein [Crocinitomicaceae bacterium]
MTAKIVCELVTILVNYDSLKDTVACVESIHENETNPPFIIIVDNSNPRQAELSKISENFPNVYLIHTDENLGFTKANNRGVQWAQAHLDFEYLLFLNNDTLIAKNALSKMIDSFAIDPDIGIVTSKIMYADHPHLVWYGGADFNSFKGWPKIVDIDKEATEEGANRSRFVSFASGCVMLFSKASIDQVNGFNENYFIYAEDLDLSLRTIKAGRKIYYNADSVIFHKVHGSLKKDGSDNKARNLHPKNPSLPFFFYHMKVNQYATMREHLSVGKFILFNFYFWTRYNYFVMKCLFHGRFSIIGLSLKTKWAILSVLFRGKTRNAGVLNV